MCVKRNKHKSLEEKEKHKLKLEAKYAEANRHGTIHNTKKLKSNSLLPSTKHEEEPKKTSEKMSHLTFENKIACILLVQKKKKA